MSFNTIELLHGTGFRLCKRACLAILLGSALPVLAGCSTPVVIEPPSLNHPANPDAIVAPPDPMPDTLNVGAVAPPEKNDNPHAGHVMH